MTMKTLADCKVSPEDEKLFEDLAPVPLGPAFRAGDASSLTLGGSYGCIQDSSLDFTYDC